MAGATAVNDAAGGVGEATNLTADQRAPLVSRQADNAVQARCRATSKRLPHPWGGAAIALIVYATYANWLATLLAALWGAGGKLAPIAAGDHEGSAAKEGVVSFLLVSLSVAFVVGIVIIIVGIWGIAAAPNQRPRAAPMSSLSIGLERSSMP